MLARLSAGIGVQDPSVAGMDDPPAAAMDDPASGWWGRPPMPDVGGIAGPLAAGVDNPLVAALDGEAASVWLWRALLPKLGWGTRVSAPMLESGLGHIDLGPLTGQQVRPMMHGFWMWASQTSCTISWCPMRYAPPLCPPCWPVPPSLSSSGPQ